MTTKNEIFICESCGVEKTLVPSIGYECLNSECKIDITDLFKTRHRWLVENNVPGLNDFNGTLGDLKRIVDGLVYDHGTSKKIKVVPGLINAQFVFDK